MAADTPPSLPHRNPAINTTLSHPRHCRPKQNGPHATNRTERPTRIKVCRSRNNSCDDTHSGTQQSIPLSSIQGIVAPNKTAHTQQTKRNDPHASKYIAVEITAAMTPTPEPSNQKQQPTGQEQNGRFATNRNAKLVSPMRCRCGACDGLLWLTVGYGGGCGGRMIDERIENIFNINASPLI